MDRLKHNGRKLWVSAGGSEGYGTKLHLSQHPRLTPFCGLKNLYGYIPATSLHLPDVCARCKARIL